MEIGYFTMPSHPPECGLKEGHDWDLQTLRWLDELGYQEAWIGEHHTAPWEPHPSPDLILAQAFLQTKNIRLGPGGFLLPYHHPAELANRVAMLDHLSEGRLNFGVAASGLPSDWAMFNVDGMSGQNRDMTREALEIILKMWTEDAPWTHTGKFWTVNKPDTMFDFLKPHLKPLQAPHPPIGVAGLSKGSDTLKLAGERGYIPMSLNLNPAYVGSHWESVEIGAASQQELERLHAEHGEKVASVQSLRSRLVLLGMAAPAIDSLSPGKQVEATTNIPAPIAGVVTERDANPGLNVETTTKLFTVVDLSSVWVIGALHERDFSRVHVGASATVTTTAYPGLALHGRVSYIDPQVSPDTRTARVRVEVSNPRQELRLGMYADIEIVAPANTQTVTIPRSAVQNVGDRQVVYLAHASEPGRFIERAVRLGEPSGERVEVLSGVKPGDQVVTAGSFFVRAERERVGMGRPR